MSETRYFLNLTNGLLDYREVENAQFIRIQSTWCEQKRWNEILLDLDHNFLFNLAIGNNCIVRDYSAKKQIPRAIYQGLVVVKYILEQRWFGQSNSVLVRKYDCTKYFEEIYKNLSVPVKRKLDYYVKFLQPGLVILNLGFVSGLTDKDGDYSFFRSLIHENSSNA